MTRDGEFIRVSFSGEIDNPFLQIVARYPGRFGLTALFAGVFGMSLGVGHFFQGAYGYGYTQWFNEKVIIGQTMVLRQAQMNSASFYNW